MIHFKQGKRPRKRFLPLRLLTVDQLIKKAQQGSEAARRGIRKEIEEMRNPGNPQRRTEAMARRTQKVIETYQGKSDLERTWDLQPRHAQAANHEYLLGLRKRIRNVRNYLQHRADSSITI